MRGAFGGSVDLDDVSLDVLVRVPAECQRGTAADDHQDVVEVVRDPAGQAFDRLHLLRLPQLLLEHALFADVAHVTGEGRIVSHPNPSDRQLDRKRRPVGTQPGELQAPPENRALARAEMACEAFAMRLPERRRDDQLDHLLPDHVGARVAEDRLRRRVELEHLAGAVDHDHGVERGIDHRTRAGLALAHRQLRVGRIDRHAVGQERLDVPLPELSTEDVLVARGFTGDGTDVRIDRRVRHAIGAQEFRKLPAHNVLCGDPESSEVGAEDRRPAQVGIRRPDDAGKRIQERPERLLGGGRLGTVRERRRHRRSIDPPPAG